MTPEEERRFGQGSVRAAMAGGVLLRAGVALGALLLLAMCAASVWPTRAPRHPLEPYLRLGRSAGAEALRQDLLRLSPEGRDAGPALQRLVTLGFACDAPGEATGAWTCVHRRPHEGRTLLASDAGISVVNGRVAGISVRMELVPPR